MKVLLFPGGGTPHMKGVRMLVGNFETDLGLAQAFFEPLKETMLNTDNIYIISRATLNETLTA